MRRARVRLDETTVRALGRRWQDKASVEKSGPQPPLCFVLMPFGRKTDASGRTTDFDAVYRQIIASAVQKRTEMSAAPAKS